MHFFFHTYVLCVFKPEDGGSRFFRKHDTFLQEYQHGIPEDSNICLINHIFLKLFPNNVKQVQILKHLIMQVSPSPATSSTRTLEQSTSETNSCAADQKIPCHSW
jgi:hypothetical protein